jgi:hypothetical protein
MFEHGDIVQNPTTGVTGIVVEIPRDPQGSWVQYMTGDGRLVTTTPDGVTLVLRPPALAYEHIAWEKRGDALLAN